MRTHYLTCVRGLAVLSGIEMFVVVGDYHVEERRDVSQNTLSLQATSREATFTLLP